MTVTTRGSSRKDARQAMQDLLDLAENRDHLERLAAAVPPDLRDRKDRLALRVKMELTADLGPEARKAFLGDLDLVDRLDRLGLLDPKDPQEETD